MALAVGCTRLEPDAIPNVKLGMAPGDVRERGLVQDRAQDWIRVSPPDGQNLDRRKTVERQRADIAMRDQLRQRDAHADAVFVRDVPRHQVQ